MNYEFPIITHLDQVRSVIDGQDGFIIAEREWGFVANYVQMGNQTFPEIRSESDAIRRECRGIMFSLDGRLISRPFQKFFNVNERTETLLENIDLSKRHVILEKMDGCLTYDTVVTTPYGPMTMAEICSKDQPIPVLAYDHSIQRDVWAEVIGTSVKEPADNWYRITLDDGTTLDLTDNHKVWCVNKSRYLTVADLEEGDEVRLQEG